MNELFTVTVVFLVCVVVSLACIVGIVLLLEAVYTVYTAFGIKNRLRDRKEQKKTDQ